jgi:hypothetical protein
MLRRPPHRVHKIDTQIAEYFKHKKESQDEHSHRRHHFGKLPSIPTAGGTEEQDDKEDYRLSNLELWAQEEIKSGHRIKRGLGLFHGQHKENLPDYHYHNPDPHHHHHHHNHQQHVAHGQDPPQRSRTLPHLHLHGEVLSVEGRDSAKSHPHPHHHPLTHSNQRHSEAIAPLSLLSKPIATTTTSTTTYSIRREEY